MQTNGVFEFKVEGKTIGFKFGMYAGALTERVAGCSIMELFQRIHGQKPIFNEKGEVTGFEKIPGLSTLSLLQYYYGGAAAYARDENLSLDEVSDMIAEIGEGNAATMFTESVRTYLPKKNEPEKTKPTKSKKNSGV